MRTGSRGGPGGGSVLMIFIIIMFGISACTVVAPGEVQEVNPAIPESPAPETVVTEPITNTSGLWWEVYFTDPTTINDPQEWQASVIGPLVRKIDAATSSIHIASFEFNLTPVAEALILAKRRGVDVRVLTDDEYGLEADKEPGRGQFAMLEAAGIEIRADDRSTLMHNKFWIFDNQSVWTGSTNITENGVFNQNNNVLFIRSTRLAALYEAEFNEMWDGEFGPTSTSQLHDQFLTLNGSDSLVVFTSEDGALEQAIIPLVYDADESVRFMAFVFTDYSLAAAMIERTNAGVDVAGVFESFGSYTDAAEFQNLFCAGVNVRRDGNPRFMHHKVIIIDESLVITGSMNFSTQAETRNDENVLVIDNPEIAREFIQEFERVWSLANDPQPDEITCE